MARYYCDFCNRTTTNRMKHIKSAHKGFVTLSEEVHDIFQTSTSIPQFEQKLIKLFLKYGIECRFNFKESSPGSFYEYNDYDIKKISALIKKPISNNNLLRIISGYEAKWSIYDKELYKKLSSREEIRLMEIVDKAYAFHVIKDMKIDPNEFYYSFKGPFDLAGGSGGGGSDYSCLGGMRVPALFFPSIKEHQEDPNDIENIQKVFNKKVKEIQKEYVRKVDSIVNNDIDICSINRRYKELEDKIINLKNIKDNVVISKASDIRRLSYVELPNIESSVIDLTEYNKLKNELLKPEITKDVTTLVKININELEKLVDRLETSFKEYPEYFI